MFNSKLRQSFKYLNRCNQVLMVCIVMALPVAGMAQSEKEGDEEKVSNFEYDNSPKPGHLVYLKATKEELNSAEHVLVKYFDFACKSPVLNNDNLKILIDIQDCPSSLKIDESSSFLEITENNDPDLIPPSTKYSFVGVGIGVGTYETTVNSVSAKGSTFSTRLHGELSAGDQIRVKWSLTDSAFSKPSPVTSDAQEKRSSLQYIGEVDWGVEFSSADARYSYKPYIGGFYSSFEDQGAIPGFRLKYNGFFSGVSLGVYMLHNWLKSSLDIYYRRSFFSASLTEARDTIYSYNNPVTSTFGVTLNSYYLNIPYTSLFTQFEFSNVSSNGRTNIATESKAKFEQSSLQLILGASFSW